MKMRHRKHWRKPVFLRPGRWGWWKLSPNGHLIIPIRLDLNLVALKNRNYDACLTVSKRECGEIGIEWSFVVQPARSEHLP